jgi:hypothetical protein
MAVVEDHAAEENGAGTTSSWLLAPPMPKGLPDPRDAAKARAVLLSFLSPLVDFDPRREGLAGWSKPHSELVAGYCGEDSADYLIYYDAESTLEENAIAAQLLDRGGVRGDVVLGLTRAEERFGDDDSAEHGGGGLMELQSIDIAAIVVARTAAALGGGVTDRVHRANMRRGEMRLQLQQTNFTPIDL